MGLSMVLSIAMKMLKDDQSFVIFLIISIFTLNWGFFIFFENPPKWQYALGNISEFFNILSNISKTNRVNKSPKMLAHELNFTNEKFLEDMWVGVGRDMSGLIIGMFFLFAFYEKKPVKNMTFSFKKIARKF